MPAPQSAFANADPPGEAGSAAGGARADWHGPGTGAGPAQAFALASHSSGALAGAYGGPPPPEAPYASPSKPGGAPGAAERRHSGALPAWQPAAAPAWRPPQPARNLRQYMSAEQAAGSVGHRRAGSWGQGSPAAPGAAQQPGGPALWAQAFDSAAPAPAIAPAPAWPHDAPAWGPQPLGAAPAYAAEPYHDPARALGLEPAAPWQPAPAQPAAEAWQNSQAPYASQQPPPPAPWPAQDAWGSGDGGAAAGGDAPAHGTGSWAGSQGAAAGAERAPNARAAPSAPGPWGARAALGAGPGSDVGPGGAATSAPRTADEALRTPAGRPPAAAVAWGFGGRVVLLQPGGSQGPCLSSYSLCVTCASSCTRRTQCGRAGAPAPRRHGHTRHSALPPLTCAAAAHQATRELHVLLQEHTHVLQGLRAVETLTSAGCCWQVGSSCSACACRSWWRSCLPGPRRRGSPRCAPAAPLAPAGPRLGACPSRAPGRVVLDAAALLSLRLECSTSAGHRRAGVDGEAVDGEGAHRLALFCERQSVTGWSSPCPRLVCRQVTAATRREPAQLGAGFPCNPNHR